VVAGIFLLRKSSTKETPQIWKLLSDAGATTHPSPHDACQTKLVTNRKKIALAYTT
jgi:hypothetical protein